MTTSTLFDASAFEMTQDYWVDLAPIMTKKEDTEVKKNTKHYACVDPMMLMLFIASCLEHDLITEADCEGLDPDKLLNAFVKPGHPVFTKLQGLFGIAIHTAAKTFRSLQELMQESGVDFSQDVYDSAYRNAESMKIIYSIDEIDEDKIRQLSLQADYVKHNQFLKYEESEYLELVSEINYLFNTCPANYVVQVTKEVENDLYYLACIKPGVMHYNTYATSMFIPFVVAYMDKFGQVPSSVDTFKQFVFEKILATKK